MKIVDYIKSRATSIKASLGADMDYNSEPQEKTQTPISAELKATLQQIEKKFSESADLLKRELNISGVNVEFILIEGMVNLQTMSEMILEPLLTERFSDKVTPKELFSFIQKKTVLAADVAVVTSYEEIFKFIMSGFVVVLIDGLPRGFALGAQGFSFRSISEPSTEVNERGAREGFTEPLRINMTMVRRRVKSPNMKFELMSLGKTSNTDICLMYMTDRVSATLLKKVKSQLKRINLETIVTSGSIQAFLEGKPWSIFSGVGVTERPDSLCAKIQEGRIAILVDGTPFALIVPYLFSENFQSIDDYAHKAYYATFIRLLKYLSFIVTILLPGLYVGIGTFHPALFPHALLFNIAAAEEITPFPLFIEALIIHLLYEIMREAGLRLPRAVGHAVSIVGALVIGDAAVTAGLIGAPMVLVVALTAISSFVVPSLYEPVALLRFGFIIIGGTLGLYGIALASMILLINVCSLSTFGMPYMSPIAPFSGKGMRDTFVRASYKSLVKDEIKIQDLAGSEIDAD